jgi:hypothetical protein
LYKLLRGPSAYQACSFDEMSSPSAFCQVPDDECESAYPDVAFDRLSCITPPADELERLREWFVRGEAMPLSVPIARRVGLQQVRAISSFIAAGADCSE